MKMEGATDPRQTLVRTGTPGTGRASRTGGRGRIGLVSSGTQPTERKRSRKTGLPAPGSRAAPAVVIAWASVPGRRRTPVTGALLAIGQLHSHSGTAEGPSVQLSDGVCGIARVLELNERKTGRVPGHPHAPQGSVVAKRPLQFGFVPIVS